MLTAYLVCLVVGGVFVGLSVVAGLGKGADGGGKDFGKDFDKDLGKGFGKGFGKDFDKDLELDEPGHDFSHEPPLSEAALAGHPNERRTVPRRRWRSRRRGLWLPFASMRFWTFGSCFFGLTGVALTQLAQVGEPAAALTSLGAGLVSGTATAWLVRRLRQPVGAVASTRGWVGSLGELVHPLGPGQVSKVRVRPPGRPPRELLAVLAKNQPSLPRDTRVVVLDFREGHAVVQAADLLMLPVPEPAVSVVRVESEEEDA